MNKINKNLKIAGFCILGLGILNIYLIVTDFLINKFEIFYLITDIIGLVLSLVTGAIYLYYSKKDKTKIVARHKTFFIISLLNIFNNIIVWFFTLWIQNTITKARFMERGFVVNEYKNTQEPDSIILDESSYEVKDSVEWLNQKLNEINELKEQGKISEEEYKILREEAVKKYMQ